ncbi:uncharacterized protein LOC142497933 [Ascaphus truei]|uniref:uncharacterized protein LOC142497933 n=1 Tax=Ascaphus truei TaxID=8439 RepID=UPI003F593609
MVTIKKGEAEMAHCMMEMYLLLFCLLSFIAQGDSLRCHFESGDHDRPQNEETCIGVENICIASLLNVSAYFLDYQSVTAGCADPATPSRKTELSPNALVKLLLQEITCNSDLCNIQSDSSRSATAENNLYCKGCISPGKACDSSLMSDMKCTGDQTQCVDMTIRGSLGAIADTSLKGCGLLPGCSESLQFSSAEASVGVRCCDSNFCNSAAELVEEDSSPNGVECYSCSSFNGQGCSADDNSTVQCSGPLTSCLEVSGMNRKDGNFVPTVIKGCATPAMCNSSVLKLLQRLESATVQCCTENLCNTKFTVPNFQLEGGLQAENTPPNQAGSPGTSLGVQQQEYDTAIIDSNTIKTGYKGGSSHNPNSDFTSTSHSSNSNNNSDYGTSRNPIMTSPGNTSANNHSIIYGLGDNDGATASPTGQHATTNGSSILGKENHTIVYSPGLSSQGNYINGSISHNSSTLHNNNVSDHRVNSSGVNGSINNPGIITQRKPSTGNGSINDNSINHDSVYNLTSLGYHNGSALGSIPTLYHVTNNGSSVPGISTNTNVYNGFNSSSTSHPSGSGHHYGDNNMTLTSYNSGNGSIIYGSHDNSSVYNRNLTTPGYHNRSEYVGSMTGSHSTGNSSAIVGTGKHPGASSSGHYIKGSSSNGSSTSHPSGSGHHYGDNNTTLTLYNSGNGSIIYGSHDNSSVYNRNLTTTGYHNRSEYVGSMTGSHSTGNSSAIVGTGKHPGASSSGHYINGSSSNGSSTSHPSGSGHHYGDNNMTLTSYNSGNGSIIYGSHDNSSVYNRNLTTPGYHNRLEYVGSMTGYHSTGNSSAIVGTGNNPGASSSGHYINGSSSNGSSTSHPSGSGHHYGDNNTTLTSYNSGNGSIIYGSHDNSSVYNRNLTTSGYHNRSEYVGSMTGSHSTGNSSAIVGTVNNPGASSSGHYINGSSSNGSSTSHPSGSGHHYGDNNTTLTSYNSGNGSIIYGSHDNSSVYNRNLTTPGYHNRSEYVGSMTGSHSTGNSSAIVGTGKHPGASSSGHYIKGSSSNGSSTSHPSGSGHHYGDNNTTLTSYNSGNGSIIYGSHDNSSVYNRNLTTTGYHNRSEYVGSMTGSHSTGNSSAIVGAGKHPGASSSGHYINGSSSNGSSTSHPSGSGHHYGDNNTTLTSPNSGNGNGSCIYGSGNNSLAVPGYHNGSATGSSSAGYHAAGNGSGIIDNRNNTNVHNPGLFSSGNYNNISRTNGSPTPDSSAGNGSNFNLNRNNASAFGDFSTKNRTTGTVTTNLSVANNTTVYKPVPNSVTSESSKAGLCPVGNVPILLIIIFVSLLN